MSCGDGGRDCSHAATSWGMLGLPKAGKDEEKSSPRVFGGITALPAPLFWACDTQNCEIINLCYLKPPKFVVFYYNSPRKLILAFGAFFKLFILTNIFLTGGALIAIGQITKNFPQGF